LEQVPDDLKPLLVEGERRMGFRANDGLLMARLPGVLKGLAQMAWSVYGKEGRVPLELRKLMAYITSTASGCVYCRAHTAHGAFHAGVATEKIEAAWDYETSPLFSAAERAALRFAQAAGHAPVEVTDAHFEDLRKHFDDDQIAEMVGVLALFGFLNKWNAVLETDVEAAPGDFAALHLR
ncbi:MAG: carboxymuconolactone decarboxylase family protein, partial [Rhodobacteraceae bacterium]|nr:carboxymuconolactone decarboxylase family protein [Paracoccaceae bacterium]